MQAPLNTFMVDFEKPFNDEIETKSGIKFYRDVTFNPENFAATNGTVTALPRYNNRKMDIVIGDQIYFSYLVVYDMEIRDRDTPIHRNLLYHNEQNYWKVANDQIYFRVRNNEMLMLNGYFMLDIVEEEIKSSIVIPEYLKKQKLIGRARVVKGSDDKVAEFGDLIFFDRRFVEVYDIFGKEIYILGKDRILGKL